jgi:nucleoside-diphosphate-sugar epimerase
VGDRVIAKFMLNALNNKQLKVNGAFEKLDFTYVDDTAMGIFLVATSGKPEQVYNITRGVGRTLYEAANLIRDIVGKGFIITQDKDNQFPSRDALCIDKAREDLLFNPTHDLEYGLVKYYNWFRDRVHWFTTSVPEPTRRDTRVY